MANLTKGKKMYSCYDSKGKLWVDCTECERGKNGTDDSPCSSGYKVTKGNTCGCFAGTMIEGTTTKNESPV